MIKIDFLSFSLRPALSRFLHNDNKRSTIINNFNDNFNDNDCYCCTYVHSSYLLISLSLYLLRIPFGVAIPPSSYTRLDFICLYLILYSFDIIVYRHC